MLKVANTHYLSTGLYKRLNQFLNIDYQENDAFENARRLYEREVDIALIPVTEFALHGGLIGLDFGVAASPDINLLWLYLNCKTVQDLKTIFLYKSSSASLFLLKLILQIKWSLSPNFVRTGSYLNPNYIQQGEGALVRKSLYNEGFSNFNIKINPLKIWGEIFDNNPFVFLVWACRKDALSLKEHKEIRNAFFKCRNAWVMRGEDKEFYTDKNASGFYYYFSDKVKDSLNIFYKESYKAKLLPAFLYKYTTFRLLDQSVQSRLTVNSNFNSLLTAVSKKQRLSIYDAKRLVKNASLADLSILASKREVSYCQDTIKDYILFSFLRTSQLTPQQRDYLKHRSITNKEAIFIYFGKEVNLKLDDVLHLIEEIKSYGDFKISGINVFDIYKIENITSMPLRNIIHKLISEGVEEFSGFGAGMLINHKNNFTKLIPNFADYWVKVMKWVHYLGGHSFCVFRHNPSDSWEDRLIHLIKIWQLQNEIAGFSHIGLETSRQIIEGKVNTEELLRHYALVRIFLDNIDYIVSYNFNKGATIFNSIGRQFGVMPVNLNEACNSDIRHKTSKKNISKDGWLAGFEEQSGFLPIINIY